jgi:CRISPR system Cascade subunit CasD
VEPSHTVQKIAWGDDFPADAIGQQSDLTVIRKDQVITRQGWQFADRREHIAIPKEG